jgi:hypothetical protein
MLNYISRQEEEILKLNVLHFIWELFLFIYLSPLHTMSIGVVHPVNVRIFIPKVIDKVIDFNKLLTMMLSKATAN